MTEVFARYEEHIKFRFVASLAISIAWCNSYRLFT